MSSTTACTEPTTAPPRLASIDLVRGGAMVLMLLDHLRDTFYLHQQVSDPMSLATDPALFFSRLCCHFCAPAFIFLAGVSAWLKGHPAGVGALPLRAFLAKRGLFIIALELTLVSFAWNGRVPWTVYLQVMWAIGICMLVLALLHRWPRWALLALGLLLTCGHHLLSGATADHPLGTVLLHRGYLHQGIGWSIRVSYPVLPWIGVILLGYGLGPLFSPLEPAGGRIRKLVALGSASWAVLLFLRCCNLYGESSPWRPMDTPLLSLMDFLNFTKYPPSADFLLLTLGGCFLALAILERFPPRRAAWLVTLGSAPLFFYLTHLYLLLGLQRLGRLFTGSGQFNLGAVWQLWVATLVLLPPLWAACRAFSRLKRRRPSPWLRYL